MVRYLQYVLLYSLACVSFLPSLLTQSARGVVARVCCGRFEKCPVDDPKWISTWGPFERGLDQPFYRTLVDTRDRQDPMMTLAAEENLSFVYDELDELEPVDHPFLDRLFAEFSDGRHVLNDEHLGRFPDES